MRWVVRRRGPRIVDRLASIRFTAFAGALLAGTIALSTEPAQSSAREVAVAPTQPRCERSTTETRIVVHLVAKSGFEEFARQLETIAAFSCFDHVDLRVILPDERRTADAVEDGARWLRRGEHHATRIYILAGHGHGLSGVGDGHARDAFSIEALRSALLAARGEGEPLDVIGFDACSMATAEVAAALASEASLLAGSADLTPSVGWPVADMVARLDATRHIDEASLTAALAGSYVRAGRHHRSLALVRTREAAKVSRALAQLRVSASAARCSVTPTSSRYLDRRRGDPEQLARELTAQCSALPRDAYRAVDSATHEALAGWECQGLGCDLAPISLISGGDKT